MKKAGFITLGLTILMGLLIWASTAYSQFRPLDDGRIVGNISNINLGPIPKAKVQLESSNQKRTGKTSKAGKFDLSAPDGWYTLTIEKCGFLPYSLSNVEIKKGTTQKLSTVNMIADPEASCP